MKPLAIDISCRAKQDIDCIAEYTKSTWGWRQADVYLANLEAGIELLAENPAIGRPCEAIEAGLRRLEIGKHVVFYIPFAQTLLIVRVLHQRMLPFHSRFEP